MIDCVASQLGTFFFCADTVGVGHDCDDDRGEFSVGYWLEVLDRSLDGGGESAGNHEECMSKAHVQINQ